MVPNLPMPDITKIAMERKGLVFLTGEPHLSKCLNTVGCARGASCELSGA